MYGHEISVEKARVALERILFIEAPAGSVNAWRKISATAH